MSISKKYRYGDKLSNFSFQKRFLKEIADCCGMEFKPPTPVGDYFYYGAVFNPAPYGSPGTWWNYLYINQINIGSNSYFFSNVIMYPGANNPNIDYLTFNSVMIAEQPQLLLPSAHFSANPFENNVLFGIIGVSGLSIEIFWSWDDGVTFVNGSTVIPELYPFIPVNLECTVNPYTIIDVRDFTIPAPPAPSPQIATLANAAFNNVAPGCFNNVFGTGGYYSSNVCERMDVSTYYDSLFIYLQDQFGSQIGLSYNILGPTAVKFSILNVNQGMVNPIGTSIDFDYGCTGGSLGSLPVTIVEV